MKIDQEEFKRKAQHILDTVVKPQVEKYEQAKAAGELIPKPRQVGAAGFIVDEYLHAIKDNMTQQTTKVLYSAGWGAGFYTWGAPREAITDSTLIDLIERGELQLAEGYVEKTYPDTFTGGVQSLVVAQVPKGEPFMIQEYDGSESIVLQREINWIVL